MMSLRDVNMYGSQFSSGSRRSPKYLCATTGLARAAYEYALEYAKQRESWGQPIINHQAVALKLADMVVDLQAARLMTWDAAYAVDAKSHLANMKAVAAKSEKRCIGA